MAQPAQTALPRWRGFNLMEMFGKKSRGDFQEDDFRWMAEWGFDFVRLPLCYRLWTEPGDVYAIREEELAKIDRAVELGRRYRVHISINFHHAPGYCVNPSPDEPFNLWKDAAALEAFCFHWELFARRYRGITSKEVSFNLVNEPEDVCERMTRADHSRVMRAAVARIRAIDPDRLIILDGLAWGKTPLVELADLSVAQSCRAYWPHSLSHYDVPWRKDKLPEPVWPGVVNRGEVWDRRKLEEHYAPWADLARQGIGVHCGEGGCYSRTPHHVFLAWLRDVLEILTGHNIGYALWNLRGPFGLLDSDRADVAYEDWHGHRLDRKLLTLLQEF